MLVMAGVWLSLRDAAARVRSTERTVKRWQAAGMVTEWRMVEGQRARFVDEDVLLAWWRDRMDASPTHQYRLRRRAAEAGRTYTPPPRPMKPAQKVMPVATREELADDQDEAERPRSYEPLDHMKPMSGHAEYSRLMKALRRTPTPCRDIDDFTNDPIPADRVETLALTCAVCPLIALCAAYEAAARPQVGFWAGKAVGRVSAPVSA